MPLDLKSVLPVLLPRAIEWANEESRKIIECGEPLSDVGIKLARLVGVAHPDKVRISTVPVLPLPEDAELREVALSSGLLGPGMVGLTLGYGIYACEGHIDHRLVSHECRHVQQYEAAGSIENFLPAYLEQIADFGYVDAPFEVDAREHEIDAL